ncbi:MULTISPECIES: putative holin-like toxin [Bacillaceae]|nr:MULTISPECIES: putative holin-like toxin [Bacillaceae]URM34764.1 putative holin-like toxin [Cytobacillus firmus]
MYVTNDDLSIMIAFATLVVTIIVAAQSGKNKND